MVADGVGGLARSGGPRPAAAVASGAGVAGRRPGVSGRVDRALADLVGGFEGGVTLFELACAKLARAAREAGGDEPRFRSHPAGALRRLRIDVEDALRVAALAVELHETIDGELPSEDRAAELADVLLDRARELARSRLED